MKPRTNIEMYENHLRHNAKVQADIERDGCCNPDGPTLSGHCRRRGGLCQLVIEFLKRVDYDPSYRLPAYRTGNR